MFGRITFILISFVALGYSEDLNLNSISAPAVQDSQAQQQLHLAPQAPVPVPVPVHAVESGTLRIVTDDENAEIYLDGRKIGTNSCIIEKVPLGQHEVYAVDNGDSKSMLVYPILNSVREVNLSFKRQLYFSVTPSFAQVVTHVLDAFGPSIDIGMRYKKSYYGLNFHWCFSGLANDYSSGNYAYSFGGAIFQWNYTIVNAKDVFELSPGFNAGFWYFDGGKESASNYMYSYSNYTDYEELFFGGPCVKMDLGYKRVFLEASYTLLIGTRVGSQITVGINTRI